MADLFQGSALPSTVTTTQAQTTAPDFYTNYLQDIANLGQNAVTQGGVAGLSPLQQQAFQMAPQASFAGSGTLGTGANLATNSGTTSAPSIVDSYMNPYTHNVVDEMGRLQQQNIQRNILPGLSAAGASTGNFGSSRQANATGQTLADMQANLTGQQYSALNTGYNTAMTNAQADLTRELQAGQTLGSIGNEQNTTSLAGLNELNTLGGVQQAQGQKLLDQPMTQTQNFAKLLQGYTIPTGSTQQSVSPGTQGNYANSPLSQIAGLGSLITALFPNTSASDAATAANIASSAKNNSLTMGADGVTYSNSAGSKFTWNGTGWTPVAANGGLISMADGGYTGSVNDLVLNDAVGGNTYIN